MGASWFNLRTLNRGTTDSTKLVVPCFAAPFTAAEIGAAFKTFQDPDAAIAIPVTHKWKSYVAGVPDVSAGSSATADRSVHFVMLDEYVKSRAPMLAWFRDVEQQVLGGVNLWNLNAEKSGAWDMVDVFDENRICPLRVYLNPQSLQGYDVTIPYGVTDPNFPSKLPIDVNVQLGTWLRTDVQGDNSRTWFEPDRGIRSDEFYSMPNDITNPVQYFDARTSLRENALKGVEKPDLTADKQNATTIRSVVQFDIETWNSLPVTSSRKWFHLWASPSAGNGKAIAARDSALYFERDAPGNFTAGSNPWAGIDAYPFGVSRSAINSWWNQTNLNLPHFYVESSDHQLFVFSIKMYASESNGWALSAVSSRIIARLPGYNGTPVTQPCEGRLMARYNPRADTLSVGIYALDSVANLSAFTFDLYDVDFGEWVGRLFADSGTDALLGIRFFYGIKNAIKRSPTKKKIMLGSTTFTNTPSQFSAVEEIVEYHMGAVTVPEVFGDHRDITEVTYKMWVPMVGFVDLNAYDVVGKKIALIYYINLVDGSALAQIQNCDDCQDGIIFSTSFMYGVDIPLRINPQKDASIVAMNAALKAASAAIGGAALGGVAGAIVGAVGGGVSGVLDGTNTGLNYSVGTISGSTNMMTDFRPKLIVYAPSDMTGSDYAAIAGLPSADTFPVSAATGYLACSEVRNSNILPARYADEIVGLLKSGVYAS